MPSTRNKQNKASPTVLILSIVLFIGFLGLIFNLGNEYIQNTKEDAIKKINKQQQKKVLIEKMTKAIRERTFIILSMAKYEDAFKLDELNQQLAKHERDFITHREDLLAIGLGLEEKNDFDAKLRLTRETSAIIKQVATLFLNQQPIKGGLLLINRAIPIQKNALNSWQQLINQYDINMRFQLAAIEARNVEVKQKFKIFRFSFVFVALFGFVFYLFYLWKKDMHVYASHVLQESKLKKKLSYQESHDALTGLINKEEYENRLLEVLQRSENNEENALLLIDIDHFKQLDSRCGQQQSGALLQLITKKIQGCLRNADLIARVAIDEFAIILIACDLTQVKKVASNILNEINALQITGKDKTFTVSASIGITQINDQSNTEHVDQLLAQAKSASQLAKKAGRNQFKVA